MRKNPHNRILKWEFKEQHLSIVPKSYSYIYIYILESKDKSFWQFILFIVQNYNYTTLEKRRKKITHSNKF